MIRFLYKVWSRRNRYLINWKIKAGSLFIAIFLFWYVQYTKNITRVLNIRVEKPDLPGNLIISRSAIPTFMSVKLYGPRELMDFNISEFRVLLTNPRPEAGDNIYRTMLSPDLPASITATFQKELHVYLDNIFVRELPLDVVSDLRIRKGLQAGYVSTRPETIKVRGPYEIVSRMVRVQTEPLIVATDGPAYSGKVLLSHLPEFVRLAPQQPLEVEVHMKIRPGYMKVNGEDEMIVQNVPVRCLNDVRGVRMVSEKTVNVLLRTGAPEHKVTADQLQAEVFCPVFYDPAADAIRPDTEIDRLRVQVQDRLKRSDLEVLQVDPPQVKLRFDRQLLRLPTEIQQGFKEHLIQ